MRIIAIRDPKDGGYTAFHEHFPSVVVESNNMDDIRDKLINSFHDIIKNSKVESMEFYTKKNIDDKS